MKLVYISSSILFSGSANSLHVMKMANSLSKNVNNVTLVVRGVLNKENYYEYYDVTQNFKVINFNVYKHKILAPFMYMSKVFINFYKLTKEQDTYFFGRDLLSLAGLSLFTRNIAIEVHDIPKSLIKKFILKKAVKYNKFKKVVVITDSLKRDLINLTKIEENRIIVLHDGSDIHSFSKFEDKNQIGYIGSVNRGRGIELIVELATIHSDKKFHIVGGTENDLRNKLEIDMIPKNLICHGYLSQKKVKTLVEKFYVVLAPYQEKVGVVKKGIDTSRWMSPIKLFEYMSYGKAIIVSDLPVLKEVIRDNFNGLIANPSDIEEWSRKIDLLYKDESTHAEIKSNAYNTLVENYTWDKRAVSIIEEVQN
ncbi:glycosyltransferase family 4 protein [Salinicoccus cyprini]|uniref:Glycosyltransferase family 4 protein n=1 Tax=Salinicoccus cyprini TaxID=2493691 RepID=A0A558AXC5_9STAP|nr:glycosyltransferase family 4 protein [Salinicoccus cyprini]TVT28912.1 glycosyltransferase family 4 protein [Salinicoccus cyprini]